jgi:BASS family bile acid:Na+ symporter
MLPSVLHVMPALLGRICAFAAAQMVSVGLSLKPADFVQIFQRPMPVLLGLAMSYGLVPLLAVWVGEFFIQDPALRAGLLLTACTSSNHLSNMYSQTAGGDTALSVALTTLTTVMGVWTIPLLCKAFIGAQVSVDGGGIIQSCAAVIIAPMLLGVLAKHYFPESAEKARPVAEVLGVVAASVVTASAVATCVRSNVVAAQVFPAVAVLYTLSAIAGYRIPRLLGVSASPSRSLSLTTALKSSAFGYVLAQQCCPTLPNVWAVSAGSVLWNALVGPLQASVLGWYPSQDVLTAAREESMSVPVRKRGEHPWLPWVDLPIRDQPAAAH